MNRRQPSESVAVEKPCVARSLSLCKLPLTALLISHAGRAKHLTEPVAVAIENSAVPKAAKRGIITSRAGIGVNNDNLFEVTCRVVLRRLFMQRRENKFVIFLFVSLSRCDLVRK